MGEDEMIKFSFTFLWYDFWIGLYFDTKKKCLYICPLPCCAFKFWKEIYKTCQHEGCTSTDTIACMVDWHNDEMEKWETDTFYYCPEHAAEEGFCCCCGLFCAGMESFDFIHPGFCDNCYDEIRDDDWQDEDGFDFFDDDIEPMQEYYPDLEIEETE